MDSGFGQPEPSDLDLGLVLVMKGRAARRLWRSEAGFTLVEMSVSVILSALILGAVVSVMYSVSQNVNDSGRHADLQSAVRNVVVEMVVELRQAESPTTTGTPVERVSADRIVFYTDRAESEGPEKVVYERKDCSAGRCTLWMTRYAAEPGSGPDWDFLSVPMEEAPLLEGVESTPAVFGVVEWVGDPATKSTVPACGGTGEPDCDFPLVAVTIRAVPTVVSAGAETAFEISEEVRLRNA